MIMIKVIIIINDWKLTFSAHKIYHNNDNNCDCNSYFDNDSTNKTEVYDINNFMMRIMEFVVIMSEN